MPVPSSDPTSRLTRARISLDLLSLGDAFGDRFFAATGAEALRTRSLPPGPWLSSDDTEMALGIYDCLARHGRIEQDALARILALRYQANPLKGYGGTIRGVFHAILEGMDWQTASARAYDGEGSMGNGGAMRVPVLGAYFADDLNLTIEEARRSAAVTHAHPDGQAGAIAVAVAAAWTWRSATWDRVDFFRTVLEAVPPGATYDGIARARDLPAAYQLLTAVAALGNGTRVVSSDTVPLCLWIIARHPDDIVEALWTAVAAEGDRDTTCAIIAGVMAGLGHAAQPPSPWLEMREPLHFDSDRRH